MIINKDINPERNIYYLGAVFLELVKKNNETEIEILKAYSMVNSQISITFNLFILVLDWLFILNLVKIEDKIIYVY